MYVIRANTCDSIRLIAVHIDKCLEAVLFAAIKHPVNRTFLIGPAMVCIKTIHEIVSDDFFRLSLTTDCIGDKFQIFFKRIFTINNLYKLNKAANNIILKILIITDRNDIVLICLKCFIFAVIPFTTCIGKPVLIQRVATKHTADRIRNKGTNISAKVNLADSNILILNLWCQLILQSVNVDENTIQFFLIFLQFCKTKITLIFPPSICFRHLIHIVNVVV